MKVKLLNNGGYNALKDVKFPVIVEGFKYGDLEHCIGVTGGELIRVGADKEQLYYSMDLAFLVGEECEIVDE